MKIQKECYYCLKRLIDQAVNLATQDRAKRSLAKTSAVNILNQEFSDSAIPAQIATKFHRVIIDMTHNMDPYLEIKRGAMNMAKRIFKEVAPAYGEDFKSLLKLSVLGNAIDFFRKLEEVEADIKGGVNFAVDDEERLKKLLGKNDGIILLLADNAGEQYFDLPLVRCLEKQNFEVIYMVKKDPVQNDLTMEDLRLSGTLGQFKRVFTTGTATVGLDLTAAPGPFMKTFDRAKLIIAKGMGYYETLSHLPEQGNILHLLMAKCRPVAESIGVPLNSYVAWLH